jgi:hypothetical protein
VTALTVPERHLEALKLCVIEQAAEQLEAAQQPNPKITASYDLLTSMRISADRAQQNYTANTKEYVDEVVAGGYPGPLRWMERIGCISRFL